MDIRKFESESITACMQLYDVKSQLQRFVYKRSCQAFEAGDRKRDAIRSIEELVSYRTDMRKKFIEAVGGLPLSDTPLNAKVTGVVEYENFRIEKVIFESRPSTYVTANLYIPDNVEFPCATVLFLCGHSNQGKQYGTYQGSFSRMGIR